MEATPATTTRLLNRLGSGDASVADELVPLVYAELHRLARGHLAGDGPRAVLQPTELVHEAWMKLTGGEPLEFAGRDPFYALASKVMRSVLVDHVRARAAQRRGGDRRRITLLDAAEARCADVDVLALDEAMKRLAVLDPELHELVELRFFGGLKHPEIARLTRRSLRTVERSWRLARAWLHAELGG